MTIIVLFTPTNITDLYKYIYIYIFSSFCYLIVLLFLSFSVIISRRQKRLQLMRIRQKDVKKLQLSAGQEGTYRRKPTPVKRYAGDLLAPVSFSRTKLTCLFILLKMRMCG